MNGHWPTKWVLAGISFNIKFKLTRLRYLIPRCNQLSDQSVTLVAPQPSLLVHDTSTSGCRDCGSRLRVPPVSVDPAPRSQRFCTHGPPSPPYTCWVTRVTCCVQAPSTSVRSAPEWIRGSGWALTPPGATTSLLWRHGTLFWPALACRPHGAKSATTRGNASTRGWRSATSGLRPGPTCLRSGPSSESPGFASRRPQLALCA